MGENPEISIDSADESAVHKSEHRHDGHHHRHKKRIKRTYSLFDDMLLAFLITFAAAVANYSENIPESLLDMYKAGTSVIFLAVWLGLSLYSGLTSKWKFAVFTALFWIIPAAGMLLYESGPDFFGLSVIMYVLSEFFRLLTIDSAAAVMSVFGVDGIAVPVIFMLINLLSFFAGVVFVILRKEEPVEIDE